MTPPPNGDGDDASGSSDSSLSIDGDVAFAFVDFAGVDFGGDGDGDVAKASSRDASDLSSNEPRAARRSAAAPANGPNEEPSRRDDAPPPRAARETKMPDGQRVREREVPHDPKLFEAQERRVENLCRWYELGVRPSLSEKEASPLDVAAHEGKDDDLFASEADDLRRLLLRSIEAQDDLNTNLPPHPTTEHEGSLRVAPSTIEGAGDGLFASAPIPRGAVVCHYAGYRHHYKSQQRLRDRAYVLKLQNGWPKHDRRNDGFVDALPTKHVLARYINDARNEEKCNVAFEHIQEPGVWHCPVVARRDIAAGEELFVSYGPRYWSESRMIGG